MKMNKILFTIMMFILIVGSTSAVAYELPLRVVVNGEKIVFPDAQPFVDDNSRTQVPARFVTEALGATVSWNGDTQTVTIKRGGTTVEVSIDKNEMYINGEMKWQDTAPLLKDDRTFVPLRFVSEALGATVDWQGEVRTAYIDLSDEIKKPEKYNINGFEINIKQNDSFFKNSVGGYSIQTEAKLVIEETIKGIGNPVLSLIISRNREGSNVKQEIDQSKEILLQVLGQSIVDEIFNYINTIANTGSKLTNKSISAGKYLIETFAGENSPIVIYLYEVNN